MAMLFACIHLRDIALGFHSKVLVVGWLRHDFCEDLSEAFPMSNRVKASWLQDKLTAGQGHASLVGITNGGKGKKGGKIL